MESHWVYKPHLRAVSITNIRWPTPNKLHGNFADFFCLIALFGFFFFLSHQSFACMVWFLIWYFHEFWCVCLSVCFSLCIYNLCFSFLLWFILFAFLYSKEREGSLGVRWVWRQEVLGGDGEGNDDQNICMKKYFQLTAKKESLMLISSNTRERLCFSFPSSWKSYNIYLLCSRERHSVFLPSILWLLYLVHRCSRGL